MFLYIRLGSLAPMILNVSGLVSFLGQTDGQICKVLEFHFL